MNGLRQRIQLTPFTFILDRCLVHILEVIMHKGLLGEEYTVAVKLDCGKISTRVFDLTVKNERELKAKLMAEITKLRMLRIVYGDEITQGIVGGGGLGL